MHKSTLSLALSSVYELATLYVLFFLSRSLINQIFLLLFVVDPDDPEYIRQLRRPAEVKEDINLMDDR